MQVQWQAILNKLFFYLWICQQIWSSKNSRHEPMQSHYEGTHQSNSDTLTSNLDMMYIN